MYRSCDSTARGALVFKRAPYAGLRCVARCVALLLLACMMCGGLEADAIESDRSFTQYVHSVWQTEEGLPDSSIHALAQTADGYLWIATAGGLARFDGNRFAAFTKASTPALGEDDIAQLYAASD